MPIILLSWHHCFLRAISLAYIPSPNVCTVIGQSWSLILILSLYAARASINGGSPPHSSQIAAASSLRRSEYSFSCTMMHDTLVSCLYVCHTPCQHFFVIIYSGSLLWSGHTIVAANFSSTAQSILSHMVNPPTHSRAHVQIASSIASSWCVHSSHFCSKAFFFSSHSC